MPILILRVYAGAQACMKVKVNGPRECRKNRGICIDAGVLTPIRPINVGAGKARASMAVRRAPDRNPEGHATSHIPAAAL